MPVSRIAALRASGSLRYISTSPRLASIGPRYSQASALASKPFGRQCRLKSTAEPPRVAPKGLTSKASQNGGEQKGQQQTGPRPSLWAFLWQAIKRDLKRGRQNMKNQSWRDIMRDTPGEAIGGIVAVIVAVGAVGYVIFLYFTYFNSPKFTRYPEPVAQALRKALYFSNQDPDPKRALKYYKQAVELADEHGLDQFSDDYMGIKIQLAAWLEKIHSYDNAIMILENMLNDCKRWVDAMEKAAAEGTLSKYDPTLQPQPKEEEEGKEADKNAAPPEPRENFWGKRTRLLKKAVGISVKLANLYSDEHVLERETAHERIVWAVETTLRELNRRAKGPLKEGEGEWMADSEVGGALESLALSYFGTKQFHLAVPLLFQALRLSEDQCHTATLMGNIATAFAEHPLLPPGDAYADKQMIESKSWATPQQQRKAYLHAAENWANNAIANSKVPKGEKRTPECDVACAAAVINLGSILAQMGKQGEAKKKFEQAIKMIQEKGLEESEQYLAEAEAGLTRLNSTTA
ncbi:hypothetical protein QBC38DRAFT_481841 [Podospora fimiseda]|uniref:TPR domain-containing protein n=1 Tax=Podospora fimiseda TaxID=252190 RepID=A0AAN7BLQ1_9PEZI|nr:hypothetical protein QBC38DRAFT_481841 [Podospora fimiseda]